MAVETAERNQRDSPLAGALDRVGDRWSLLIVEALLDGPRRYGELAEQVTGIAPNVLADRLRRLEAGRVITSSPYLQRPRRLAYQLTQEGQELAGVLRLLAYWGNSDDGEQGVRHLACGSMLEARWYCPTCEHAFEGDEGLSSLRFA